MKRVQAVWIAAPIFAAAVIALAVAIIVIVTKKGTADQTPQSVSEIEFYSDTEYTEYPEKWQEGTVTYNGRQYLYNRDNKIYLLMGIDKDEKVTVSENAGIGGGRSDAMFLLVANRSEKKLSVVSINRNTMTRVEVYSERGKKLGYYTLPICLQHAYGDGGRVSCNRSVDAVSYLFHDLPISGYMALNMGGISALNDAVGGVPVTVLENLSDPSLGVELVEGEEVTLSGSEAYVYLRNRDTEIFDSSSGRLRRQEQYLTGLFSQMKASVAGNSSRANEIYEALKEYLVTDMNVASIISEWMDYEYAPDDLWTVPGRMTMGEETEEYQVDQAEFRKLIMDVFYDEIR